MFDHSTILTSDTSEEWRPVLGFDRTYAVSSLGRIMYLEDARRTRAGQFVKQHVHPLGYHYIATSAGNTRKKPWVHVIVAAAFLGPCPDGYEVNHIDRNKGNNSASNLEYVTHRENMLYSHDDIYRRRKITNEQVIELISLYKSGNYRQRALAKMFCISAAHVCRLVRDA